MSRFADTRREDAVPQLKGMWVKEDSSEKGVLMLHLYNELYGVYEISACVSGSVQMGILGLFYACFYVGD